MFKMCCVIPILTLDSIDNEVEHLVPAFEAAFVQHMHQWTMEGKPRTGRRYSQYSNSLLPTPEDRLLFILSYLKVAALQVAHGAMLEMSQSSANKWIHVLLPVLEQTLIDLWVKCPHDICKHLSSVYSNCAQQQRAI